MKLCIIKRNLKFWFQKRIRGWSDDECWNLNLSFIEWVNSRFKRYMKDASKMIDLEFHTFKYKRKKYTQKEIIERIIKLSDEVLEIGFNYDNETKDKINEDVNEMFDLFKIVFWAMWW